MQNPKFTIITPAYNVQDRIESCILSVANQSYKNIEHLIIDGLSTDDTLSIVKNYSNKHPHIHWISEKDNGIYDAMNKGVSMSNGEWILFLGSDDVFYDKYILGNILAQNNIEELDVLYGNVIWGDSGNIYDGKFSQLKIMKINICHQAIFFRKQIFEKLGEFETKYKVCADWVFNMKWMNDDDIKKKYVDFVISKYNTEGLSSRLRDEEFIEDYDDLIKKHFPNEYVENYNKIVELEKEILKKEQVIQTMKLSKVWKLRDGYFKVKFALFSPVKFIKKYTSGLFMLKKRDEII
jgi:glycosyltransferase involved in cell wall biosynthesis